MNKINQAYKYLEEAILQMQERDDIRKAIQHVIRVINEFTFESSEKVYLQSDINKLSSYIESYGFVSHALQINLQFFKKFTQDRNDFYNRTIVSYGLLDGMEQICRRQKLRHTIIEEQKNYVHVIANACSGRWSQPEQEYYIMHIPEDYNTKICKYIHTNRSLLSSFNNIGKLLDTDQNYEKNMYINPDPNIEKNYHQLIDSIIDIIQNELSNFENAVDITKV